MSTDPLILTVAPNGAYKQAGDHPAVPLTARQLAAETAHCGPEPWAMCAFGATGHACPMPAAALVAQSTDSARCLGRPPASADGICQRFAG